MILPLATGWDRKDRINVDADLLCSGTKGVTISDGVRFTGASNLGVQFWIELKTLVGDVITKGATILTAAQLSIPVDSKRLITINSSGVWYINQNLQSGTIVKDWTVAGDILIGQNNNPNFTISNLVFFDNITTQKEVSNVHAIGCGLQEFAHQPCISHHPLQTAYFDGANNVTPDVVEQYNYDKYYYIDVVGARLTDFDGTPTNGATITEGTDGDGDYVQFDAGNPMVDSQILSIVHNQPIALDPVVNIGDVLIIKCRFKIAVGSGTVMKISTAFVGADLISEAGEGSSVFNYENSQIAPSSGHSRKLSFNYTIADSSPITSSVRIYDIQFYMQRKVPLTANHGVLINFTDDELGLGANYDTQSTLKYFYDPKGDLQDSIYESPIQPVFGDNIEIASGMPTIQKALNLIDASHDISLDITDFAGMATGQDFTIFIWVRQNELADMNFNVFGFTAPGDSVFINLHAVGRRIRMYYWQNAAADLIVSPIQGAYENNLETSMIFPTVGVFKHGETNPWKGSGRNSIVGYREPSTPTIAGSYPDIDWATLASVVIDNNITIGAYGFWDRILTDKEVEILRNNSLLKNPSIQMQQGLRVWLDIQNAYDDAGTLKIPNLMGNPAIVTGYTDLADLKSNLIDTDSLR